MVCRVYEKLIDTDIRYTLIGKRKLFEFGNRTEPVRDDSFASLHIFTPLSADSVAHSAEQKRLTSRLMIGILSSGKCA